MIRTLDHLIWVGISRNFGAVRYGAPPSAVGDLEVVGNELARRRGAPLLALAGSGVKLEVLAADGGHYDVEVELGAEQCGDE